MSKDTTSAPPPNTEQGEDSLMDHQSELAAMKKMMLDTKVDGNKSVWAMTLETFGMADGKHIRDDVLVDSLADGLELLNDYVVERQKTMDTPSSSSSPLMDLVPLESFNATQDQFLTAFLKWSEQKGHDKSSELVKINVSKARRRLDAYFAWMQDNRKDFEEPLTLESILPASKIWDIQITYDEQNSFVWWIDLGSLDKAEIKKLSPSEHLRYVVWFSHLVMLDKNAQDNGAMIIEDLGMIGFWKMATLVPTELGAKMDRLTIGILPVKMKKIYIFGAARWMHLLMGFLKPFLGKKMRERMVILPKKTNIQTFCDGLVTRKNIPKGFSGLEGETPRDMFIEKFM